MWILSENIERQIQAAAKQGAFDNLAGQGQPLHLDDDIGIPEDQRMAWRILKNAGYVPEGVSLRRDIFDLEALVSAADPHSQDYFKGQRRLMLLRLRLEIAEGGDRNLVFGMDGYRKKLLKKMSTIQVDNQK